MPEIKHADSGALLSPFPLRDLHADLISFGRPFISNPDLVERFGHGWPLNPPTDMRTWYTFDEAGYTDFPPYETQTAQETQGS